MARRRGKKVYDIKVHADGLLFEVTVRLVRREHKRVFLAELEKLDLAITDTDSEKLEQRVREHINEWIKITWELWCVVSVTGGERGHDYTDETAAEITVTYYAVGTHKDGKKVHREMSRPNKIPEGVYVPFGHAMHLSPGLPPHDIQKGTYNAHPEMTTRALIRATPESIAALDNFRGALKELVNKMHFHFHPKRIEQLLTSPGLLLPAPKPKSKGKKMPRPNKNKKKVRA